MTKLVRRSDLTPSFFDFRDEFLTPFSSVFDRLFEDAFPDFQSVFGIKPFAGASYPRSNVVDLPECVKIEAEIPGLTKDQIQVYVNEDNVLIIKGEKKAKNETIDYESQKYIVRELKHSSFQRCFQLYDSLEPDKIDAKFENGILNVTIPKKQKEERKNLVTNIEIK